MPKGKKVTQFSHNILLQLSDSLGFPVANTQFWVTLLIVKEKNKITIQFPVINFQTGPSSNNPSASPPLLPGGYLYTMDGFLPKEVRPNDLVFRSTLAACNNGMSLPFSFSQDPSTLPKPISAYILQVTPAGSVIVQAAGTFQNIIPPGAQVILPSEISYVIKPRIKLCKNYIVDAGFTNTTQFTGGAGDDGIRDSHVNDAFDNVLAWCWTSNATQVDKTNRTMDTLVAIGRVNKKGKLKIGEPINLTNFGPGIQSWDTAVSINRTNKDNIIVSYGVIDRSQPVRTVLPYRAVSFDGGKKWPLNGPLNTPPTGSPAQFGDNRGVGADKFGNIWYSSTNFFDSSGNLINQPYLSIQYQWRSLIHARLYRACPRSGIH